MLEFRHQPLKLVYFLYSSLSILFVRLPYWVISSLVPAWRPRPSWSLSRTITVYGLQAVVDILYATGTFPADDPEKSAKSADKLGFVWIDPLPAALLSGEVAAAARTNNVVSARTHGYWYGKDVGRGAHGQRASPGEKVLYHLHGGGYIMGTACPTGQTGPMIADLVKNCSAVLDRAFCLEYRVSSSAPLKVANPFPAALIDAIAGYKYLVGDLGFEARNVIVCGDSAGGHLALSLVRYLVTSSLPSLPPPGAVVLLSPTVDWGCTHDQSPTSSMTVNARSDFVKTILHSGFTARSLLGSLPHEEIEINAWLSPSSLRIQTRGLFSNFPPTCIIAGGAEQTLDPMRTLRDRLTADNDTQLVVYWEYPDAAHDFLMTDFQEPEKTEASRALAQWMSGIYGKK